MNVGKIRHYIKSLAEGDLSEGFKGTFPLTLVDFDGDGCQQWMCVRVCVFFQGL